MTKMWVETFATIETTITYGVKLEVKGFIPLDENEMARLLRRMVANACNNPDDGGHDWYYSETKNIVYIAAQEDWIASTNPVHVAMLKAADLMDGSVFSID